MNKLITAYQANPNSKNIAKLIAYIASHPMALCFATAEQQAVINQVLTGARA